MWVYSNELYHYGVKDMKWGVRNSTELKVAKRYAKAGKMRGAADYAKKKGDEASKKYTDDANVLDRQAKAWDKRGHVIAAEAARRRSSALREKAANARSEYDEEANYYIRQAERLTQKASKFATKQRVDLGKNKVNEILKSSRADELKRRNRIEEMEKAAEEAEREFDEFRRESGMAT